MCGYLKNNVIILDNRAHSHNFGKVITWDTEAKRYSTDYGELQKFYNVNFYDGEEDKYTENKTEIPKIIEYFIDKYVDTYKRITLVSHNAKYDLMLSGLLDIIKKGEFLGLKLRHEAILEPNFYLDFGLVHFIDSFNYFKTSLEKLGELIGMSKTNVKEYDLSPEEWNEVLEVDGKERVITDTHILYEFFHKFLSMGFVYGISIASTSFNTFRKNFLKRKITMRLKDVNMAVRSYRGGRVEVYLKDKLVEVNVYDVNSEYPFVMRENKFSVKFSREYERITLEEIEKNKDYHNFLVRCDYKFPKDIIRTPIMVKDEKEGKLVDKKKAKNVVLTGAEILEAVKYGAEFTFYEGVAYESDYIFKEFVDTFYKYKKEAKNEYEKNFYKLILNSTYGKYGQHNPQVTVLRDPAIIKRVLEIALSNDSKHVKLDGKVYTVHDKDFITFRKEILPFNDIEVDKLAVNPIIVASEVTAYGRLLIFNYQKSAGFENVYYTDTDSLHTNYKVRLPTSNDLGALKLEVKRGKAIYHSVKDYELFYIDDKGKPVFKAVLKGVPKKAKKVGDNTYEYYEFPTLLTTHLNNDGVEVHKKVKRILREYDKGVCDPIYGFCRPLDE